MSIKPGQTNVLSSLSHCGISVRGATITVTPSLMGRSEFFSLATEEQSIYVVIRGLKLCAPQAGG